MDPCFADHPGAWNVTRKKARGRRCAVQRQRMAGCHRSLRHSPIRLSEGHYRPFLSLGVVGVSFDQI
jgi:hypothetical protein